jgi:hypothetical protein
MKSPVSELRRNPFLDAAQEPGTAHQCHERRPDGWCHTDDVTCWIHDWDLNLSQDVQDAAIEVCG